MMLKKLLSVAVLIATCSGAMAQSGQLGANQIWGNPTGAASPSRPSNIGSFLTQGTGMSITGTPKATIGLANQISAGGPTGSATQTPVLTYNAQGQLTAVSLATIAPPFSAVTGSLTCSQMPALTGFVTSSAGTCATSLGATVTVAQGGSGAASFTAHGVLLGEGGSAFGVLAGSVGNSSLPLISQGASVDPTYSQIGFAAIAGFGTSVATTLGNNLNATGGLISPTPTRAGDIIYWNGSAWVTLAGNNSGTQILTENASGVPSWAATGSVSSVTCGTGLSGGTITTSGTCAVNQTVVTNSLGSNTAIANGSYTDGPSTAQGTSGGWWASGTVTIGDTVANIGSCKLWDGTNVAVASTNFRQSATATPGVAVSLSGFISSPAGNIRISCSSTDATATFRFNDSGNSKDSTLSVHRIQ